MATPTNELEYPGSLEQVRAFMDRLLGGAEGTWTAPNGQILKFYELARRARPPEEPLMGPPPPSTRATWIFRLLDEEGQDSGQQARMEAYEEGTATTLLKFTDGYEYQTAVLTLVRDPIGEAFNQMVDLIGSNAVSLLRRPDAPLKPHERADRDEWFQYYQNCHDAGIKYTLEDLAKDVHLSLSHVKTLRRSWKQRHGLD